jgi:CRP-like cAMP-binding protein
MQKLKTHPDKHQIYLYQKCLPAWHSAIDQHLQLFKYSKNQVLFAEGDAVQGFFFLASGVVKVHKHWGEDRELILRFGVDNDIIGHRGLNTHQKVYPISATTLSPVVVGFVPLQFFMDSLLVNPTLSLDFLLFFADELLHTEQRMRDMSHLPVKERTAKALLHFAQKFGTDHLGFISFVLSRQDIAAYVGASYETVYRALMQLEEEKLIQTNKKRIALLKPDILSQISQ